MRTRRHHEQDRAIGRPGDDVGPETRQIETPSGDVETPLERELDAERETQDHRPGVTSIDEEEALPNDDPGNEDENRIFRRDIPSGMGGAGGGDIDDLGSASDAERTIDDDTRARRPR